jgi:hypothetical protein
MGVSAKTQERIVNCTPIAPAKVEEPVEAVALDGGMVRLVGPPGEASQWKQYKAVRLNGDGPGMGWFQENAALIEWLQSLTFVSLFYCLGDGHPGIWNLFAQLQGPQMSEEILDWFHLNENLYKVGGSLKRLRKADSLLWEGQVCRPGSLCTAQDKASAAIPGVFRGPSRAHRELPLLSNGRLTYWFWFG